MGKSLSLMVMNRRFYTLNETASFIFSKIKLDWEKKKLIEALAKKYGISEKKAQCDIKEFIRELRERKIING